MATLAPMTTRYCRSCSVRSGDRRCAGRGPRRRRGNGCCAGTPRTRRRRTARQNPLAAASRASAPKPRTATGRRRMAQRVVDLFELVEVDEQQRRQLFGTLLGRQQTSDLVAEIEPVGRFGEFVVARQVAVRASALRRSVMSSSRTTVAPPSIAWTVHDSDRFRVTSGSVVMTRGPGIDISDRTICRSPPKSNSRRCRPRHSLRAAPRWMRSSEKFIISRKR